ncbi:hypothetical protein C0991_002585, partial [Blastosporella zonata]
MMRNEPQSDLDHNSAQNLIENMEIDFMDAMDTLTAAKLIQAYYTNLQRMPEVPYNVGDLVMLSTLNRQREYLHKSDGRAAKFMPRYDGP